MTETELKSPKRSRLSVVLDLCARLIGAILIAAAMTKVPDMDSFIRQLHGYGIISEHRLLAMGAWAAIAAEFTLGAALLVLYRPRISLPGAMALFVIFSASSAWALMTGATEDCGCFGEMIKRTPGEALIESLVMLAVTFAAYLAHRRKTFSRSPLKAWFVFAALLAGLGLPLIFGFSFTPADSEAMDLSLFDIRSLDPIDLHSPEYLLILMDTECPECLQKIGLINTLTASVDLPVIALTLNDEEQRRKFAFEFEPEFPVGQIPDKLFWRLLGEGDIPRTIHVRDFRMSHYWDQKIPDLETLRSMLQNM